jgi:hypothetical protein
MSNQQMSDGLTAGDEPTLGALVSKASREASALVRAEIELAKAEIRDDLKNGASAGGLFGAAGFLVVLSVILLSIALAYGLVALGVDRWLAFVIVAVFYLVIAGVLIFVGKRLVKKIGPPERAIQTSKETAAYLKGERSADATTIGT